MTELLTTAESVAASAGRQVKLALLALAFGGFPIGTTEFVAMGPNSSADWSRGKGPLRIHLMK